MEQQNLLLGQVTLEITLLLLVEQVLQLTGGKIKLEN